MTFVEQGHLGGYILGGDAATYYPDLWRWLVEEHEVRRVLDVGCGEGHTIKFFRDLGCRVEGIDGIAQEDPDIYRHDYEWGELADRGDFDLVWSCEFVEHVEEQYVPNFITSFGYGRLVLLTHAEPGQSGYHHVNCQPADYWIGAMAAIGYGLDKKLTRQTRALARMNTSPWNHYARSGMAFSRILELD